MSGAAKPQIYAYFCGDLGAKGIGGGTRGKLPACRYYLEVYVYYMSFTQATGWKPVPRLNQQTQWVGPTPVVFGGRIEGKPKGLARATAVRIRIA